MEKSGEIYRAIYTSQPYFRLRRVKHLHYPEASMQFRAQKSTKGVKDLVSYIPAPPMFIVLSTRSLVAPEASAEIKMLLHSVSYTEKQFVLRSLVLVGKADIG